MRFISPRLRVPLLFLVLGSAVGIVLGVAEDGSRSSPARLQ